MSAYLSMDLENILIRKETFHLSNFDYYDHAFTTKQDGNQWQLNLIISVNSLFFNVHCLLTKEVLRFP